MLESCSESSQEEPAQQEEECSMDEEDAQDTPKQDPKHQPDEVKRGNAGFDLEAGSRGTGRRVEEGNVQPPTHQSDRPTERDAESMQIKTLFHRMLNTVAEKRKKEKCQTNNNLKKQKHKSYKSCHIRSGKSNPGDTGAKN